MSAQEVKTNAQLKATCGSLFLNISGRGLTSPALTAAHLGFALCDIISGVVLNEYHHRTERFVWPSGASCHVIPRWIRPGLVDSSTPKREFSSGLHRANSDHRAYGVLCISGREICRFTFVAKSRGASRVSA